MKRLCALVLVMALVLAIGGAVWAADKCFDLAGFTFVAKAFVNPAKGACKDIRGFYVGFDSLSTGTACTASDGSQLTLTITTTEPGPNVTWDHVTIPLPSGTGGTDDFISLGAGTGNSGPASIVECSPKKVPIP